MIPFNKPFYSGKEIEYILEAVHSGKISGNGTFTKRCQSFFERRYGFKKCLLTSSCTDALEMCALLSGIGNGDEVIVPSFSFVSTALAFARQGAKIVFADSRSDHPGIDEDLIEPLITPSTRAIVPVHYGGISCDMDKILKIAAKHNLLVIEDAAHAIDSSYNGRPLGSIGHLATFSFHETKNLTSGEGGLLVINDERLTDRSEVVWEKGTNRANFLKGLVNKYEWVDLGSSFLPSEITAAYLWAQVEHINEIQEKRIHIWNLYKSELTLWAANHNFQVPVVPTYATNNGHLFYIIFQNPVQRSEMIDALLKSDIQAVFHYQSLHRSRFYTDKYNGKQLYYSDHYSDCLLRLPFYFGLEDEEIGEICSVIKSVEF